MRMQKYTQAEVAGLAGDSPSSIHLHTENVVINKTGMVVGRRRHYDETGKDLVVAYFRALHRSKFEKYRDFIKD
jgi:hypothetical protein